MVNTQWNEGRSYTDLILEALGRHPDDVAFIDHDGSETTYGQAQDLFGRLRAAYLSLGAKHGTGIGMLSANRADAWLSQWAGVVDGGRYTPLHPMASLDDQVFIVGDASLSILVVDADNYADRGRAIAEACPNLVVVTLGPADFGVDLLALAATLEPLLAPNDDVGWLDTCMVIYTGGTTGRSKGVIQPHRSIVTNHLLQLSDWPWPKKPCFLATAPISHATGWFMVPTLWLGGTVVMRTGFDVDEFLDCVERYHVNVAFAVPSMIYKILDEPRAAEADLSSLEMLVYGAAPMSVRRLIQGMELFGQVFLQLYGQTEVPNVVTTLLPEEHDPARPDRLASCGRPSGGVMVRIRDEDDNVLPTGEVGELCIRGPLVMDGYLNRPEETASTLKDGWLRTGDLAMQDVDGYISLVGRAKDLIISGGFNVYPAEVEIPILTHPDVAECAVVGLPHDVWGEAVTAFIVPRPGTTIDPDEIIALVRELKGPVQAPKSVQTIDAIPLTALGKPDKKALRASFDGLLVGMK